MDGCGRPRRENHLQGRICPFAAFGGLDIGMESCGALLATADCPHVFS